MYVLAMHPPTTGKSQQSKENQLVWPPSGPKGRGKRYDRQLSGLFAVRREGVEFVGAKGRAESVPRALSDH